MSNQPNTDVPRHLHHGADSQEQGDATTKEELIAKLNALVKNSPGEGSHIEADGLLLEWINDPEISKAYKAISKWYA